jgi:hypothetical protein
MREGLVKPPVNMEAVNKFRDKERARLEELKKGAT